MTKTVLRPSTYAKTTRLCLVCGNEFQGTARGKYCSNRCKQKNKNKSK